jgi:predicted permease
VIHAIRELQGRIVSFFRRRERDEDFEAELSANLEFMIEDNLRSGMAPEEARRMALVKLGGMQQTRELHRESRGLPAVDALLRDARYGFRSLRRDSSLAFMATLIIGIGVGASSIVFSVFNTVLLRPLPFEDPGALVWIANGRSKNLSSQTVQIVNLNELREGSRSFVEIAGYSPFYGIGDIRLTGDGEPERVTEVPVTERFFALLGVKPHLGRFFSSSDAQPNSPKTVVLSHGFWERRFKADARAVGQVISLDGKPATIIGVLPPSFDFATTFTPGGRADLFRPFPLSPENNKQGNTLALIGRLKSGSDLALAQAEATVVGNRIKSEIDKGARRNTFNPRLVPLRERVSGNFRYALTVLLGAVGFVMMLVCANLSNLLLVRATARQKEMAIRAALGAGRGQLIRQLLVESILLASAGAAVGLAIAFAGTELLSRIEGAAIPLLSQVRLDGTATTVTLLLAMLTGILFGVTPALQLSATAPHAAMKEGSRGSTEGGVRRWLRPAFVVGEIAMVCVLLTGAGLLLRSLLRVLDVQLGFKVENVIALRIDPGPGYSTTTRKNQYFDNVLEVVRTIPGVNSAGLTDALPLSDNFGWRRWDARTERDSASDSRPRSPLVRMVDEAYFAAMEIPLRSGRVFTRTDNESSEAVMIVNEAMAKAFWPNGDAIGRSVTTGGTQRRIVGVVGGVRYFGLEQDSDAEMYMPIRQTGDFKVVDLVVKSALPPERIVSSIRDALRQMDPNLPATRFRTMRELVDNSVFPRRSVVLILAGFAGFGLVLASLGIYAVISYSVSQRKQEIGIRMALGASPSDLRALVLGETFGLTLVGVLIGVPAAWMAARTIQGLLFGVTLSDPLTHVAVLAVLAVVAGLAGYLPARRASALNPLEALRAD